MKEKMEKMGMHGHMDKAFMNGLLKMIILRNIKSGNDYPYAILKTLDKKKHHLPMKVTKNTVYNTLNALEKSGYVKSEPKLIRGKVHKRYRLTASGKEMVERAKKIIVSYIKEAKLLMEGFDE